MQGSGPTELDLAGRSVDISRGSRGAMAESRPDAALLTIGHRLMGVTLTATGGLAQGRTHLDRALALYEPSGHRSLAMRFGQDVRVASLSQRSLALWVLGFPHAALTDAKRAVHEAREIGQAATSMYALFWTNFAQLFCGKYEAASALSEELIALAQEKKSDFWMPCGNVEPRLRIEPYGQTGEYDPNTISGLAASRATSSTFSQPLYLWRLAGAYAELGQFDNASRCIGDAIAAVENTKETSTRPRSIVRPAQLR
jgi:tetratricopeptide (TPR) repeat protein